MSGGSMGLNHGRVVANLSYCGHGAIRCDLTAETSPNVTQNRRSKLRIKNQDYGPDNLGIIGRAVILCCVSAIVIVCGVTAFAQSAERPSEPGIRNIVVFWGENPVAIEGVVALARQELLNGEVIEQEALANYPVTVFLYSDGPKSDSNNPYLSGLSNKARLEVSFMGFPKWFRVLFDAEGKVLDTIVNEMELHETPNLRRPR